MAKAAVAPSTLEGLAIKQKAIRMCDFDVPSPEVVSDASLPPACSSRKRHTPSEQTISAVSSSAEPVSTLSKPVSSIVASSLAEPVDLHATT